MKKLQLGFIKSVLGEDVLDKLQKFEIVKPNSQTVVDPEEIRVALHIVPRTVLSYLFQHLKPLSTGDVLQLDLPWHPNSTLLLNKHGEDNYKGEVVKDGKVACRFQNRSLPSVGLILLTTFELYDLEMLKDIKNEDSNDKVEKLQNIIDERLLTHKLIEDIVDRKISQREAVSQLVREKLNSYFKELQELPKTEESLPNKEEEMENKKKTKLRAFLESIEKKRQEPISLDKSEDINCPDCGTIIYKNNTKCIKTCICFGDHAYKDIKIQKSDNGKVKIKFPKSFCIENVEMLLDALKKRGLNG